MPTDIADYIFDDVHKNANQVHGVTREEAVMMAEGWNGRFHNYYGRTAVYLDIQRLWRYGHNIEMGNRSLLLGFLSGKQIVSAGSSL